MAKYYVDPISGNDSNAGSELAPFASFSQALSVVGADGEIEIVRGTVYGGNYTVSGTQANLVVYSRLGATMDAAGYSRMFYVTGTDMHVVNLNLTGWDYGFSSSGASGDNITALNCVLYQKGAKYDNTFIEAMVHTTEKALNMYNCTAFGIQMRTPNGAFHQACTWRSCIIYTDYDYTLANTTVSYNASKFSQHRGTGGWDIATFPVPFLDASTTAPDLRFDSAHAQFAKYVIGGYHQSTVGSTGRFVVGYARLGYSKVSSNKQFGNMVNDNNYYDESWSDIVITADSNDDIDFDEGGAELTATIADGTYTSGTDYATAIATAMNTAGSDTHAVTFSASQRLAMSSDGTDFNLLWSTGTNTATSAGSDMGFDTATDDTAQSLYTADDPLNGGGTAGRTSVVVSGGTVTINTDVEPDATSARVVTPIIDHGAPRKLLRMYLTLVKDGAGEIDDDTSGNRTVQVRAQNTPFDAQDAAATTTLDWTSIQRDGLETVSHTYRYWQFGFVLRTNAV